MKALFSLVAIFVATTASAQRMPVDDRGNAATIPEDAEKAGVARKVMEQFAVCTYRNQAKMVEKRLSVPVIGAYPSMSGIARSECLNYGELRFDPIIFRGSLFAVMYRKHFERLVPNVATAPVVNYQDDPSTLYSVSMRFADCVVRASPAYADRLVRAGPTTRAEAEALNLLMPAMSGCVSKGRSSSMHKSTLRGFIAESLFKLSSANTAGAN